MSKITKEKGFLYYIPAVRIIKMKNKNITASIKALETLESYEKN